MPYCHTLSAGYNYKASQESENKDTGSSTEKNYLLKANVDKVINFDDGDKKCGNAYLNYYDEANNWVYFPDYEFRILISDTDE